MSRAGCFLGGPGSCACCSMELQELAHLQGQIQADNAEIVRERAALRVSMAECHRKTHKRGKKCGLESCCYKTHRPSEPCPYADLFDDADLIIEPLSVSPSTLGEA